MSVFCSGQRLQKGEGELGGLDYVFSLIANVLTVS